MVYRFTDHTADYGVEVEAFTVEEAFCDASRGMYEILFGKNVSALFRAGNKGTPEPLKFQESSLSDLLHAWLTWHLERFTQDRRVASGWRIRVDFRRFRLEGATYLNSAQALNLKLETEIKAVTFHQLKAFASLERTQLHYIVDV